MERISQYGALKGIVRSIQSSDQDKAARNNTKKKSRVPWGMRREPIEFLGWIPNHWSIEGGFSSKFRNRVSTARPKEIEETLGSNLRAILGMTDGVEAIASNVKNTALVVKRDML